MKPEYPVYRIDWDPVKAIPVIVFADGVVLDCPGGDSDSEMTEYLRPGWRRLSAKAIEMYHSAKEAKKG